MTRNETLAIAAVGVPPVILAGLGFWHPHHLDGDSAGWWMTLHLILLPLFPLLGVAVWVVLRGRSGLLAWGARAAALAYIVLYGGLDAIAGIGAGAVMLDSGAVSSDNVAALEPLYSIGNKLGLAGAVAFLAAGVLTAASIARDRPRLRLFVPGAALLLAADVSFLRSHIYWPVGVLTVLAIGAGLVLIEASKRPMGEPIRDR